MCGRKFEFDISKGKVPKCCSPSCSAELRRKTCLRKYGTDCPSKNVEVRRKISKSTKEAQPRVQATNLAKYGVPFSSQSEEVRQKIRSSMMSEKSKEKFTSTMRERYGVDYAMQSHELFLKHSKSSKSTASDGTVFDSGYERDVYEFLLRNNVDFQTQVPITYVASDGSSHVTYVDFCAEGILFEVKGGHLLDGVFDYSGVPISDKLEVYRKNHIVVITDSNHRDVFGKPNSSESNGFKYLNKCPYPLVGVDVDLFRNPTFPYREDRPATFYDVKVSGQRSSYEAFFDELVRWRMILNRIQYSGGFIDGNQILTALNVTRTCKQPSWFSKTFAKALIQNFVTSDVVVDPFAGWGTRYDACVDLNKLYVGCDLNQDLVKWHHSRGRDISYGDAKTFVYSGPCSVLICPPYQDVEHYGDFQDSTLTQCEWLQVVMNNVPNASEYVLVCKVVDPGWEKYVVATKTNKSHFGVNHEYVLVVPGKDSSKYTLSPSDLEKLKSQAQKLKDYQKLVSKSKHTKGSWIWMSNDETGECQCVSADLEVEYSKYGWHRGRSASSFSLRNYVWINNGTENKRVRSEEEARFLESGWSKGRTNVRSGVHRWVTNGDESRYVSVEEAKSLVESGWSYGIGNRRKPSNRTFESTSKGRVHVNNPTTGEHRVVPKEEVEQYLSLGWRKGRSNLSMSNKVWIHSDLEGRNRRVDRSEVDSYVSNGWNVGRGKYRKNS